MTPALEAHFARLKARHPDSMLKELTGGAALITVPALSIPTGWSMGSTLLRFLAPNGYPVAAPDCFWAEPTLLLRDGRQPKNTQLNHAIPEVGMTGQWFSWHLEVGRWSPNCHDLLTWLGVCLARLARLE
jgi:hypothetical protein